MRKEKIMMVKNIVKSTATKSLFNKSANSFGGAIIMCIACLGAK